MRKQALLEETLSTGGEVIKLLAKARVLKAILLGGTAGFLAAKAFAPRETDVKNVKKQMQLAATTDARNKLMKRFQNQYSASLQEDPQLKSMRLS